MNDDDLSEFGPDAGLAVLLGELAGRLRHGEVFVTVEFEDAGSLDAASGGRDPGVRLSGLGMPWSDGAASALDVGASDTPSTWQLASE